MGTLGMTGNELARQICAHADNFALGFDNFFASSIDTVKDILDKSNFRFFEYDIRSKEHIERVGEFVREHKGKYEKTVFINCAAVVHTEYFYHINATFDTNVIGMRDFLEQAVALGCDQFINCSTSEIYSMRSFTEDGGVRESDYALLATVEHSQRTSYAAGKLLTEFFMKDAADAGRIKGCSIRFANVYSRNERFSKHIIPHIIESLYETGTVELLENSRTTRRTFLHNYDSCAAVLALSDTETALDGSVYNVATDEEIAITDLVALVADKLHLKTYNIVFKGTRESDPPRRLLNTDKLCRATGWTPRISLQEGLDMCIEYLKSKGKEE